MFPIASKGTAMTLETEPGLFDEPNSPRDEKAHEQRIYDGLMRGYESFLAGNITSAEDADARIREAKEWDQAVYDLGHPAHRA